MHKGDFFSFNFEESRKTRPKQLAEKQLAEKQLAEKQLAEKQLAEKQLAEKQLAENSPEINPYLALDNTCLYSVIIRRVCALLLLFDELIFD